MGTLNNSSGVQTTVSPSPASVLHNCRDKCVTKCCRGYEGGNKLSSLEGGYTNSSAHGSTGRLVQSVLCCAKTQWEVTSDLRSAYAKQTLEGIQVQNVNFTSTSESSRTGNVVHINRSDRRISTCSYSPSPQKISQIRIRGHCLRVSRPPIWSSALSPLFFKNTGSSPCTTASSGNSNTSLFGRHGYHMPFGRTSSHTHGHGAVSHSGFGVFGELHEKFPDTSSTSGVSGSRDLLTYGSSLSNRTQNSCIPRMSSSVSIGTQTPFSHVPSPIRSDGLHDSGCPTGAFAHETVSDVGTVTPSKYLTSPKQTNVGRCGVSSCAVAMETEGSPAQGNSHRQDLFPNSNNDRRVPQGLGSHMREQNSERGLDPMSEQTPHKLSRAADCFPGLKILPPHGGRASCSDQDGQYYSSVIHKQTGRDTFTPVTNVIEVAPPVERATSLFNPSDARPGRFESGCGSSLQGRAPCERVAPQPPSGVSDLGPVGQGPRRSIRIQRKCALPSVLLDAGSQRSTRGGRAGAQLAKALALCVPSGGTDHAYTGTSASGQSLFNSGGPVLASEAMARGNSQPTGGRAVASSPAARSLVTGGGANPAPSTGAMAPAGLPAERSGLVARGLPPNVIATIQNARASSTRNLYSYKWRAFENWCHSRRIVPFQCSVVDVLTFLQELFEQGLSFSTIKVYLAAISACHVGFEGVSPGAHPLTIRFMRGVHRLRPFNRSSVPSWDLPAVLEALCGPPFEPMESVDIKLVSYKTALLLALASAKRVSDIHALSVHPSCTQFAPDGAKVVLLPNAAYLPKVMPRSYQSMAIELFAFSPPPFTSEEQRRLHCLCPLRALRTYMSRTSEFRLCDQLFVCFARPARGKALSKQRLSHWIVEAIALAYSTRGMSLPVGLHAHSTRGMAASWALFKGVSLDQVCSAASWSSPHTFVRFYRLDVAAPSVASSVLSSGTGC